MELPHLTLITGGARSGKSSHALALAEAAPRRYFIATAQALDEEMRDRIARHRADRPAAFVTVEEPLAVAAALAALESRAGVVVLDCLTLWVANLMAAARDDANILAEAERLATVLRGVAFDTIVVSGEVGSGIVPENAVARRFRDLLGWTNQAVARAADRVILMVAGYPLTIK